MNAPRGYAAPSMPRPSRASSLPVGRRWLTAMESRFGWTLAVLMLVYVVTGILTMKAGHGWGDDWAQYVLHARNLITGHAYADTGYLYNPDKADVGPPSYPPGLPMLLVPVMAIFGFNIFAFKIVCFACLVLALLLGISIFSPRMGKKEALLAMAIAALHPTIWGARNVIASEAPYLLFSMATLWAAQRSCEKQPSTSRSAAWGIGTGLLLFLTIVSRSIGVTMVVALAIYGVVQRRRLRWFASVFAPFGLLLVAESIFFVKPPTYANELKLPTVSMIASNIKEYWMASASFYPLPANLTALSALVIGVFMVVGAKALLDRPRSSGPNGGWLGAMLAFAGRVPLYLWYLLGYVFVLLVASIEPNPRYLVPLFPIAMALFVAGVFHVVRRLRWNAAIAAGACAAMTIFAVMLSVGAKPPATILCNECVQMYSYIKGSTPRDAIVVFEKPRVMALFGERSSWRQSDQYTQPQLQERLKERGASVVVMAVGDNGFTRAYPPNQTLAKELADSHASLVFHNDMFDVYRLNRQ